MALPPQVREVLKYVLALRDWRKAPRLTNDDIGIVAPYRQQVRGVPPTPGLMPPALRTKK